MSKRYEVVSVKRNAMTVLKYKGRSKAVASRGKKEYQKNEDERYQRRLTAYKGVVTRTEVLGRSRFTVADNLARRYPSKYKTKDAADKQAQLLLARYLLKYKDWVRRGKRGREPQFVSP